MNQQYIETKTDPSYNNIQYVNPNDDNINKLSS